MRTRKHTDNLNQLTIFVRYKNLTKTQLYSILLYLKQKELDLTSFMKYPTAML